MSEPVIVALITGVVAIVGGFIANIGSRMMENQHQSQQRRTKQSSEVRLRELDDEQSIRELLNRAVADKSEEIKALNTRLDRQRDAYYAIREYIIRSQHLGVTNARQSVSLMRAGLHAEAEAVLESYIARADALDIPPLEDV